VLINENVLQINLNDIYKFIL